MKFKTSFRRKNVYRQVNMLRIFVEQNMSAILVNFDMALDNVQGKATRKVMRK